MTEPRELTVAEILQRLNEPPAFGRFADLSQRVVKDTLDLSGRNLSGCDFSGTVFENDVRFDRTVFRGLSWFRGAEFRAAASYQQACFFNDARFDDARFQGATVFEGADFRGIATYDRCRAAAGIDFTGILANGNFSIADADLNRPAGFAKATMMGGFWSLNTQPERLAQLEESTIYGRR